MRVLLINDNSAHPNWGAQATPFALKRILHRSIEGAEIEALPWDWLLPRYRRARLGNGLFHLGHWHGILRSLLARVSRAVDFYPSVADDFGAFGNEWISGLGGPDAQEFMEKASRADVVVYNGENSIYRNTPEGCHGLFLLWLAKTRLGKPSCLVNHTADLNEVRPIMNGMVQLVGREVDLVAAREPSSLRNLHRLGIEDAELYPDVVFAEDPSEFETKEFDRWFATVGLDDQPYYCLSASGLPASAPRGDWDGAVVEVVTALQGLGLKGVLVARDPHCLFLAEVSRRTGAVYFGPEHHFTELWPLFRGATFSVTGHFHYVIFGSMVGCPFIPLSTNNHKMQGVCQMLRWARREPFDITWLRSCRQEIVEEARQLMVDRDELSAHLRERSMSLRAEARKLGDRIGNIARVAAGGAGDGPRGLM